MCLWQLLQNLHTIARLQVNAAEAYYDIQGSTADLEDKREKYKLVPLDVKTTLDVKYHSIFGGQQGEREASSSSRLSNILTDCIVTVPKSSDTHEEAIAGVKRLLLRGPLLWIATLHMTTQALTDAGLDLAHLCLLAGLHIISGHDDEFS